MNCVTCGRSHFRFKDREHTKPASLCMGCHAAYIRENRPKPLRSMLLFAILLTGVLFSLQVSRET